MANVQLAGVKAGPHVSGRVQATALRAGPRTLENIRRYVATRVRLGLAQMGQYALTFAPARKWNSSACARIGRASE